MTQDRKSACSIESFAGYHTMQAEPNKQGQYTASRLISQYLSEPAECLSFVPKILITPKEHKRFKSLKNLQVDFRLSFFNPKKFERLYYHYHADNTVKRLRRVEARALTTLACEIIMHYYDVMTGEIGFRDKKGKWICIGYKTLAHKLNEPLSRIKKVFQFFKQRSWISIIPSNKHRNNKIMGESARKIINPQFFIENLGVEAWRNIKKLKEWLIKKAKPKEEVNKNNLQILGAIFKGVVKSPSKPVKKTAQPRVNPDAERTLITKAMQLFRDDPSKSLTEYLRELKGSTA